VKRSTIRTVVALAVAMVLLLVWAFPIIWGLITSFKTERDVLAYPPTVVFHPTLSNYWDVLFGATSILPNFTSSIILAGATTVLTMLLAVPAAYALARLALPAKRATGFYVLITQMLPPVGLVIPYYLVFSRIGWLDTYRGLVLIYLTFSLPFAIWLMVSYFEDIPHEMEEAALLDRAGRWRALWHVILPQARGGNTVRPVTVAMFNYISVEQTLWGKLAAAAMIAMLPVILLGLVAQKHIVKGLTVGAVKGGGRR
jgi:ABC-type glycerol-3-phosphate transport system permease component